MYHKKKKTQILKAFVKIILGKFSYNLFSGKLYLHMQVQVMHKKLPRHMLYNFHWTIAPPQGIFGNSKIKVQKLALC